MRIILASKSPRRQELMRNLGITDFEIIPAVEDEKPLPGLTPAQQVEALALAKAREVSLKTSGDRLVVGADTLVFLDGHAFGKPHDKAEVSSMLHALSGRKHTVITGVSVIYNGCESVEHESTDVFFRDLTDAEIDRYIDSGEPMDKAGAYGLQQGGSVFIPRIDGDYFNVIGLPVCRLYLMLAKLGIFNLRG